LKEVFYHDPMKVSASSSLPASLHVKGLQKRIQGVVIFPNFKEASRFVVLRPDNSVSLKIFGHCPMSAQYLEIHPTHPQERLLVAAAKALSKGGVLAIPTDSSYALVCQLDNPQAVQTIRKIRGVDDRHLLTLMCKDLTQLASYAKVDNRQYRLLKMATPGPFTFVLEATKEVPKRVSHPQRRTIGIRVPEHPVVQTLLSLHEQALLCTTLILPNETLALNDPEAIRHRIGQLLSTIIDAGAVSQQPTTILDLTPMGHSGEPVLIRQGGGDLSLLGISLHTN